MDPVRIENKEDDKKNMAEVNGSGDPPPNIKLSGEKQGDEKPSGDKPSGDKPLGDEPSEVKSSGEPPADLENKIIKQVEYYFGDMNLPRDRFLQDQVKQDDGWVTMEVMLKFNRLKNICDNAETICNALRKSKTGLIEVHKDNTKVRRSKDHPIPENTKERRDEILARTVYVKGFPVDQSLDQIQEFLSKFGHVENVFMRRLFKEKTFKGSVFAIFSSKNDADKFVKEEGVKFMETDLIKMLKNDYYKQKNEEKRNRREDHDEKLKKEREEREEKEKQKIQEKIPKGTILYLEGVSKETQREDLKNFFTDFAKVAWIDYDRGDTTAHVRFEDEGDAKEALEKAKEAGDGKIEIVNAVLEAKVLEGEEELKHWQRIYRDQAESRERKKRGRGFQNRKRKGGNYNTGRGGGKKFQKNKDSDQDSDGGDSGGEEGEPPAKAVKAE